jgi:rhamnogalacturonan endolyase
MSKKSLLLLLAVLVLLVPARVHAQFGATRSGGGFIVNNGANLVFTVNASGDMPSCKYRGTEYNDPRKASCIASGLGACAVTAATNGGVIAITCLSTNSEFGCLIHYYIVTNGVDNIYMATYPTVEPSVGELRYIFRGQWNRLPNGPLASDNHGATNAIESKDVYGHGNGCTTSKYYGSERAKDLTVKGATGVGVGVFTAFGNRESGLGGPFARDIENQGDGTNSDQEIYNYMNSGHHLDLTIAGEHETFRTNVLYGPYAFCFTTGATPAVPDMAFISSLGLTGYVGSAYSGTGAPRGQVVLHGLSGMNTNYTYYLGFANPTAQYWTTLSAAGSGECTGMKPGTYNLTIYKNELAVYTNTATVTAGRATTFQTQTITGDPSATSPVWRIGDWDGTPLEFLNGSNLMAMHPSDGRTTNWGPVTFIVSNTPTGKFPACQFRGVNDPTTILFTLTSAQATNSHTLRIGITTAHNDGRPGATINGTGLSIPGASTQPRARSLTTGTYRGNNTMYTWRIPAAGLVAGTNTLVLSAVGGSTDSGTWLSASWAFDCIDLY